MTTQATTRAVKWNRSQDGDVTSKCGRFVVDAMFCGCERPQMFKVTVDGENRGLFNTQREAKAHAERWA